MTVLDKNVNAFRRLPDPWEGGKIVGFGFDRDDLLEAGIERAGALAAVTSGDNSNILTARIARETFEVPQVVARIYDPRRAVIFCAWPRCAKARAVPTLMRTRAIMEYWNCVRELSDFRHKTSVKDELLCTYLVRKILGLYRRFPDISRASPSLPWRILRPFVVAEVNQEEGSSALVGDTRRTLHEIEADPVLRIESQRECTRW